MKILKQEKSPRINYKIVYSSSKNEEMRGHSDAHYTGASTQDLLLDMYSSINVESLNPGYSSCIVETSGHV